MADPAVPELIVVGCPSVDLLEVDGQSRVAPGGAGFNTALAARAAAISVGLVAVLPPHVPASIGAAFGPGGIDRRGLRIREGAMPHFHIRYDEVESANYVVADVGTELTLAPEDVPDEWLAARHVHIGPLATSSRRQLDMARSLRDRGFGGTLSAGSFQADIDGNRPAAIELVGCCDLFFLNQSEMASLYPGGVPATVDTQICVTAGRGGVEIHQRGRTEHHAALAAEVIDPTGAGDAFCGGFLAGWLRNLEPVQSGQQSAVIALSGWGSTALVEAVAEMREPRVEVDNERVEAVATALVEHATSAELDFCGFPFPDAGDPWALDLLAVATLHQYGFWLADEHGWTASMYGTAVGRRWKGSDYIWQAFTRAAAADPAVVTATRMAEQPDLFAELTRADDGTHPVPGTGEHGELQVAYAQALIDGGHGSFADLLREVNAAERPGRALLDALSELPGYREDPLAKKANLLVVMLAARPERFLDLRDPESVTPVIDYHLMRSCLRTGCVRVVDRELRSRIERRSWVDGSEEGEVRQACFDAVNALVAASDLTQAAVDGFFFANGRSVCLENEPPRCDACRLQPVCAEETDMFQPVFRTTAY